jgi:adenylate kinase family enzyme
VTGNAGAGKTTLARKIGAELDLPVFGLDHVVWQPGWKKTDAAVRDRLENELIARPVWVIEGVSDLIRGAADITIFLDLPHHLCFWRALMRSVRFLFTGRPELPPNCPEYEILPRLLQITWRFQRRVRPKILKDMARGANFIHVKNPVVFDITELRRRLT